MIIKKLSWAGILVKTPTTQILIDPLGFAPEDDDAPFVVKMGTPLETIFPLSEIEKPDTILITHTHPDHFDPNGIKHFYGEDVPLFLPTESIKIAKKHGFKNVSGISPNEVFQVNELTVKAIPAVDGYGTPQVSWAVSSADHSIFHAGDTLWSGLWWQIERKHGPFNLVCLPVNGPVLSIPGLKVQSEIKACLDPEEAVSAAKILGSSKLLPIHFGTFHNPPFYIETDQVIPRLKESTAKNEIELFLLQPGEEVLLK